MSKRRAMTVWLWLGIAALPTVGLAQSISGNPPSTALTPQQQQAFGQLIDQYATIAGGWFLEQRCHVLTADLRKEFDWNVEQTNISLGRKVPFSMLRQIQSAAQQTAAKYACDEQTKTIIVSTVSMSRQTTLALTGQQYSLASQKADDRNKVVLLLKAQKVDNQCKMMPPEVRKEFDGRIQRIVTGFSNDPKRLRG